LTALIESAAASTVGTMIPAPLCAGSACPDGTQIEDRPTPAAALTGAGAGLAVADAGLEAAGAALRLASAARKVSDADLIMVGLRPWSWPAQPSEPPSSASMALLNRRLVLARTPRTLKRIARPPPNATKTVAQPPVITLH